MMVIRFFMMMIMSIANPARHVNIVKVSDIWMQDVPLVMAQVSIVHGKKAREVQFIRLQKRNVIRVVVQDKRNAFTAMEQERQTEEGSYTGLYFKGYTFL